MAINVSLNDTEGQNWDLISGAAPGGGLGSGLGVSDGQNDTFDGGLVLSVGSTGINPQTASLDFNGREVNTAPVFTPEGIAVTRSILVSDASISPVGFARFLDSFTNTTNTTQTITVSITTNSGADGSTNVQATTSGDTTLTTADVGFVLDDANTTGGDTSFGFAYGNGKMPPPSSITKAGDLITVQYTITLKAGETKSLLSFGVQNDTSGASISDYTSFTRPLNDMRNDNYLAGLSEKEISQVVNYSYIGGNHSNGPLGLTVLTDGEGNRWGVNNNRMGVQTLDTDVLREANPGEVLFQNLKNNPTTLIAEDGQEATFQGTFGTSRTGSYSVMASPEDGYIRVMLRIDYTATGEAATFQGEYGLKTIFASAQNLVGDRNVNGSLGDGNLTIGDGGVVLDDSVSGSGGTRPAVTLVFGDTSTIDATNPSFPNTNNTQEQVSLSGNLFSATDGPPLVPMPFDTFGLLYYIALNDDSLGGVADLAKLIRPDYKALAGLSAFDISKIKNFTLTEADRLLTTNGDGNDNTIQGNYWGDKLNGGDGNDILIGLGSDDELNGDGGNDTLLGGISDDRLFGGTGQDLLDGGTGNDLMQGDEDNDTFIVDSAGDKIIDAPAQGTLDWVKTSVSYDLSTAAGGGDPLEIERLTTTNDAGTGAINLTGNQFVQRIVGNDGENYMDGKGGADTMEGRGGNDTYFVDNAGDKIIEAIGGGGDRIATTVSYTIGAGVEIELLQALNTGATDPLNFTGNEFEQFLLGNEGTNRLDGKGGADTMEGRGGNDTFYVDDAGDTIVEGSTQGALDTVIASVSFTLAADDYIEKLVTSSATATTLINLTGNALVQTIQGNAGANTLDDGGAGGADILQGLGGNDTYVVNNTGDKITEGTTQGALDTVLASVSYTLAAGVYVEALQTSDAAGTAAINLTGNALAQTITGNAGINKLGDGAVGGADTLIGLGGNDTYTVRNSGDIIVEGSTEGSLDIVSAFVNYTLGANVFVERLQTGSTVAATAINLTGNEVGQTIYGNAGANVLNGKTGIDILKGFGGADTFLFDTALGAGNIDTVIDFNVADDIFNLDDAIFSGAGFTAGQIIASNAFTIGSAATTTNHRIIYNSANGDLIFDADGTGATAAQVFAHVSTGLNTMTNADFFVV